MLKNLTVIVSIALISATSLAQTSKVESKMNPFTALEISNEFDVTVIKGSEYHIEVQLDKTYSEFVKMNVKGSTLSLSLNESKIPTDIKKFFTGKNEGVFKAIISTPGNIEEISLNGHSTLSMNQDLISGNKVTISATDNATLKPLSIKASEVVVKLAKKAEATLDVETDQLTVSTSGSSVLNLKQQSEDFYTDFQGNSELTISGQTKKLHFQAKGTSKCEITGQAEIAEFNCSGSSNTDATGMTVKNADVTMSSICVLSEAASDSLKVDLSGGASLVFNNNPFTEIVNIKSSSMTRYGKTK